MGSEVFGGTLSFICCLYNYYFKVYSSSAYSPSQIVDTLGAGDTFNAGLIHSLSIGRSLQEALNYSCKLAGSKCGMIGYEGLRNFEND